MALRRFHKLLIGSGVLFFLGYGSYELMGVIRGRPGSHLALAAGAVAAGVGLALYLAAFGRRGEPGES